MVSYGGFVMDKNEQEKFVKTFLKLFITVIGLFVCYIVDTFLLLFFISKNINTFLIFGSMLVLPSLLLIAIFSKKKRHTKSRSFFP